MLNRAPCRASPAASTDSGVSTAWAMAGVLLTGLVLVATARCGANEPPDFLNHGPDAKYVGTDECRRCHLGITTSHSRTGMGRAWAEVSPATVKGDFKEHNEIEIARSGLRYRMIERDGRYFMRQFMLDSEGRELAADERELAYAVGSNNHNQGYVVLVEGKLFQAPVCWYPQESIWYPCPGFEHDSDHFSRAITESCVFCHNGHMELLPGAINQYEQPFPMGIDCERCHGPGSLHVEKWASLGSGGTGEPDPTIVNPRQLPLERRIQVCFQCHLGDSKATHRVGRYDRRLTDYRPGQDLTEVTVPFRFTEQLEHEFGLSAQADRLILSRCYTESGGRIECLTCHDPHVTVYHPERPADLFRSKCLGCHVAGDCPEDETERAATPGLADDCVACHMREAQPDDQLFTTFTDHWIRRSIEVDRSERRRTLEIEPVLPESLSRFPVADQAFYRGRAALLLSLNIPDRARSTMWDHAERSFEEAIELGLDTDQSWFFLGKILTYQRRPADAELAYRTSLERNPDYGDAALALGQTLGEQGRNAEAAQVFEKMVERDPRNAGALAELARFRLLEGRAAEAASLYTRAAELEPWNGALRLNRGMALASLGEFAEAAGEAEHAVRLDPEDADAWEFYARVMDAAGRPRDAAEGARVFRRLRGGR